MSKFLKSLLALSSLSMTALSAAECCEEPCQPCDPCDCCEEVFFVTDCQLFTNLEFLYWKTETSPLDYAVPAVDSSILGPYKVANYDYKPGYRVSAAWYNAPHYWEVKAEYTWLYDKGSNSATPPSDGRYLDPTWNVFSSDPLVKASSLLDLHYHVGDLNAARVFDPNPHLRMRVIGGLTLSHITQNWRVRFTNDLGNFDRIKDKWRFFGGGLRVGLTADWFWGYQIYLTGRVTFATLVGTYKNEVIQRLDDGSIVQNMKYEDHRLTFHSQFLLGYSWQQVCECWSAEIFAGYELNSWTNLNEVYRPGSINANPNFSHPTNMQNGALGLHGLTLRLTFGF